MKVSAYVKSVDIYSGQKTLVKFLKSNQYINICNFFKYSSDTVNSNFTLNMKILLKSAYGFI